MAARQVPSVPNVDDPVLRNFLSAVRQSLNDFTAAGGTAATLKTGTTFDSITGLPINLSNLLDTTIPPIPTGFTANGVFTTVILTWDNPHYLNYNFAEIYRASALDIHGAVLPSSSVPLSTAIIAGTSNGFIFIDSVNPGEAYYYWVRFKSNADIYGPYNAALGVLGATVVNINTLMTANGWTVAAENVYQTGQWIGSAAILNGSIANTKIAASAVGTAQLVDGAITEAKIQDAAITNAKMGVASIGIAQIQNLAVTNAAIGALAVGEANIQALAVTNAKIGNLAVDTAQIKNLAISNAKMGLLSVATAQIQDLAVTSAKIASLAVEKLYSVAAWIGTADILNGSITNAKISGTIESDNYNGSNLGWSLDKAGGNLNLNQLTIRDGSGAVFLQSSAGGIDYSKIQGTTRPDNNATLNSQGSNLLVNAGMYLGTDTWVVQSDLGGGLNPSGWNIHDTGASQGTVWVMAGLPSDLARYIYKDASNAIPVIAGQILEFSAYTGAHRCDVNLILMFENAAGASTGTATSNSNTALASGGTSLSEYLRIGGFATAPAGSVRARFHCLKNATYTGQLNSYCFMTMPYVGIASPNQTAFSAWSDGAGGQAWQIIPTNVSTYIADLAVNTLQIAGNAVSYVTNISSYSGHITLHGSSSAQSSVIISAKVQVNYPSVTFGLYVNDIQYDTATVQNFGSGSIVSGTAIMFANSFCSASGSFLFEIRVLLTSGTPTYDSPLISVLEVMR